MSYSLILPNLLVGSCPGSPEDVDRLRWQVDMGAVLNLQTDEDFAHWGINWPRLEAYYREVGVELRRVPVQDFNAEDLRRMLPQCVDALDELVRTGKTVYVHCSGGVNRSPSTVVAYLHWLRGMELDEALDYVRQRHPCDPYVESIRLASEDRNKGEAG